MNRLWHRLREHRTLAGIACLAVLVAFTGWRRLATPPPAPDGLPPTAVAGSDYRLERFVLTMLDEDGSAGLTLTGVTMEHDPRAEQSTVTSPETSMTGPDGVRWEGSARNGVVDDDGTRVRLHGDVSLARLEAGGVAPLRLQTEQLTLYPERDQARTPAHVTLVQPGAQLQGVGMRLDLGRGSYQLNARVRGQYDTPHSN